MKLHPIIKIISGGQRGADLGGVRGARRAHITTGGMMPYGFRTENGVLPHELRTRFNFVEHASSEYPPRTRQNVLDSDATLIFGDTASRGSRLTLALCSNLRRPVLIIQSTETLNEINKACMFISRLSRHENAVNRGGVILNIAGNRESTYPGIENFVEIFVYNMCLNYERLRQQHV